MDELLHVVRVRHGRIKRLLLLHAQAVYDRDSGRVEDLRKQINRAAERLAEAIAAMCGPIEDAA